MNLKAFLSCVAMLFVITASATIINVDNNPTRPAGYYDNLQLAINSASDGDTLYVYPSNTSYGSATIDKELHLFGSGYDGTSTGGTTVTSINLDTASSPNSNSSGSSIQGFTFSGEVRCNKPNIVNVVISGNYLFGSSNLYLRENCSSWLLTNNYFKGYINLNNNNSIVISNNIFYGSYYQPIQNSNSPSVLISHNMFFKFNYFSNVFNATISDNIFMCNSATNTANMAKNNFINNLSWRSALTPYALPPEGNTGTNNISNQDPLFETAPSTSSQSFDFTQDYHLKSTSPGKNAASDGTDIGPYGGSNPFVWGGVFSIPKITQTNITNPVINQTTPINVNVKATKANL